MGPSSIFSSYKDGRVVWKLSLMGLEPKSCLALSEKGFTDAIRLPTV